MSNNRNELFDALLRPAVLHILRGTGFHATSGAVLDTLTDIAKRYLQVLAERTAYIAYSNHNTTEPTLTDVRMAMEDTGLLMPTPTASEEMWTERSRRPLEDYPERNGIRRKEKARRDAEDTQDVQEFIDWFHEEQYLSIRRCAGLEPDQPMGTAAELDAMEVEDYLTTIMKKHSKTGVESRFQGSVLGQPPEPKPIKIEGGPASIEEWIAKAKERAVKEAAARLLQNPSPSRDEMEETPVQSSEDVEMES